MLRDLSDALRMLRRSPGFASAVVALLALGVGANTAVFSVVHAVLLRPLPYRDADRLVYVWLERRDEAARRHGILTGQFILEWKNRSSVFSDVAALRTWESTLQGQMDFYADDYAERLRGAFATPNFFELLGVAPTLGRTFATDDASGDPVVVLSDGFWRRRFGADPSVIGRSVALMPNRDPRGPRKFTIVGVLPPYFRFSYPNETEVWGVLPWQEVRPTPSLEYAMVARLKPGVTLSNAQAELTSIAQGVVRGSPLSQGAREQVERRMIAWPETLPEHLKSEVRAGLLLIAVTAALVLLLACVNVGVLVLTRTVDRRRELAVRCSLGVSPWQLIKLLAWESILLAAAGGVAGVGVAWCVQPVLRALIPAMLPRGDEAAVDVNVLLFALVTCAVAALAGSLAPLWQTLRWDLTGILRQSGGMATGGVSIARWRRSVVAVEVAIVLTLLTAAAMLLHSFWNLQKVDLGFQSGGIITAHLRLQHPRYREEGRIEQFQQDVLERVRRLPGVTHAGMTSAVPLRGPDFQMLVGADGGPARSARMRSIDSEYLSLLRIPLRAGRFFDARDTATSPAVAIVSESYGRMLFGAQSPLGHSLDMEQSTEIVGVVGDVRHQDVTAAPEAAFYLPRAQRPVSLMSLVLRTEPGVQGITAVLRNAIRDVDPQQPVETITTLDQIVAETTADRRFFAVTTGAFAGVALILTVVGLYGIVRRVVSERTREIAIRISLGADSRAIRRLILLQGLLPVLVGLVLGVAGARAAVPMIQRFLFEVGPGDAFAYMLATTIVMIVAGAACLGPAHLAARISPMTVLKSE